jgi:hypothetical protein
MFKKTGLKLSYAAEPVAGFTLYPLLIVLSFENVR